jgi:hypothetical protein
MCAARVHMPSGALRALQGRAARYFSCLAKKSNQKKARPRKRSAAPTALRCSRLRAGLQTRALRALRQAGPQKLPQPLRRSAASRACNHPESRRAPGWLLVLDCPRRRRAAQGRRGQVRACCLSAAGASLQDRPAAPSSTADPAGAPSRARVSLPTFFGKAKKVGGRAALKRTYQIQDDICARSARDSRASRSARSEAAR